MVALAMTQLSDTDCSQLLLQRVRECRSCLVWLAPSFEYISAEFEVVHPQRTGATGQRMIRKRAA